MIKYDKENFDIDFWKQNNNNLCCWLDTHTFDGPIYSYPLTFENNIWTVKGIFCSLQCCKRYIIDNLNGNHTLLSLFTFMCHKLYNTYNIKASPHFHILSNYTTNGVSIVEFRNLHNQQNKKKTIKRQKTVHIKDREFGSSSLQAHIKKKIATKT